MRSLQRLPELHRQRTALQQRGLGALLDELRAHALSEPDCTAALDHVWAASALEQVELSDPHVGTFDGDLHHRTADEFRAADRDHLASTAARVRHAWAQRAVAARDHHLEQDQLVSMQAARRRGHLAVRTFFRRAPDVLTALKPCWTMSPLMVSQLLPGDRRYFDFGLPLSAENARYLHGSVTPARGRGDDAPAFPGHRPEEAAPAHGHAVHRAPQHHPLPSGRPDPRPSILPGAPISEYRPRKLAALARWIESDGRLRTEEELLQVLMAELGFHRRGSLIVEALTRAIRRARRPRPA